jgi:hypothetical protein
LFCPGANGLADLVPYIFLACPGGIDLEPTPLALLLVVLTSQDIILNEKTIIARQILSDFITAFFTESQI